VLIAVLMTVGYVQRRNRPLRGTIFITTQGGENIRLGGVPVLAFDEETFRGLALQARPFINSEAVKGLKGLSDRVMQGIHLPGAILETHSDANGDFELLLSGSKKVVIAAEGERTVFGSSVERYYWCQWVDLARNRQEKFELSNYNLIEQGGGEQAFVLDSALVSQARLEAIDARLAGRDIPGAQTLMSAFEADAPGDPRADDYRKKIHEAQFGVFSEAFQSSIKGGQIDEATSRLDEAKELFPNDPRIIPFADELNHAKFTISAKAFHDSIQSGSLADATSHFNDAKVLLPNDPSLSSLENELFGLRDSLFHLIDTRIANDDLISAEKEYSELSSFFPNDSRLGDSRAKITAAEFEDGDKSLETFLSHGQLSEARIELSKLKAMNVEPAKLARLDQQVSLAIEKVISPALLRGRAALQAGDLSGANEALAVALSFDPENVSALGFQRQISDFRYKNGMTTALKQVNADAFAAALDTINKILAERPDDSIATQMTQTLGELTELPDAVEFRPYEAIASYDRSRRYVAGNIRFVATITGYGSSGFPVAYASVVGAYGSPYTMDIEGPGNQNLSEQQFRVPIGTTVLVFGRGYLIDLHPLGGPAAGRVRYRVDPYTYRQVADPASLPGPNFSITAIKILPSDFVTSRKLALITALNKALSTETVGP
jgi:tetratricopeptide (TPR) repeat protein